MNIPFFCPIHSTVDLHPLEHCAFLRNATGLFDFGQKAYTIRQYENNGLIELMEVKGNKPSLIGIILRVIAIATIILPLLASAAMYIHHKMNNFSIHIPPLPNDVHKIIFQKGGLPPSKIGQTCKDMQELFKNDMFEILAQKTLNETLNDVLALQGHNVEKLLSLADLIKIFTKVDRNKALEVAGIVTKEPDFLFALYPFCAGALAESLFPIDPQQAKVLIDRAIQGIEDDPQRAAKIIGNNNILIAQSAVSFYPEAAIERVEHLISSILNEPCEVDQNNEADLNKLYNQIFILKDAIGILSSLDSKRAIEIKAEVLLRIDMIKEYKPQCRTTLVKLAEAFLPALPEEAAGVVDLIENPNAECLDILIKCGYNERAKIVLDDRTKSFKGYRQFDEKGIAIVKALSVLDTPRSKKIAEELIQQASDSEDRFYLAKINKVLMEFDPARALEVLELTLGKLTSEFDRSYNRRELEEAAGEAIAKFDMGTAIAKLEIIEDPIIKLKAKLKVVMNHYKVPPSNISW